MANQQILAEGLPFEIAQYGQALYPIAYDSRGLLGYEMDFQFRVSLINLSTLPYKKTLGGPRTR